MIREYFALRRFIKRPWAFLRSRKKAMAGPHEDIVFREGFSIRLRNVAMDRHIFHRIFARDEYRLGGVAPGSWETVIDVGAHIGMFAVRAAPLARRVLCYEPMAENFEVLRRNLGHSRFAHVGVNARAVAGRAGKMTIHHSDNPSAHTMFPPGGGKGGVVEVETTTMAGIFAENGVERCDFLKMDCEGAEYEIFRSMSGDLWRRIRRVALEYHPVEESGGAEALIAVLRANGFVCDHRPSRKKADKGHIFAEASDRRM